MAGIALAHSSNTLHERSSSYFGTGERPCAENIDLFVIYSIALELFAGGTLEVPRAHADTRPNPFPRRVNAAEEPPRCLTFTKSEGHSGNDRALVAKGGPCPTRS